MRFSGVTAKSIAEEVGITPNWLYILMGKSGRNRSVNYYTATKIFEAISHCLNVSFDDLFVKTHKL